MRPRFEVTPLVAGGALFTQPRDRSLADPCTLHHVPAQEGVVLVPAPPQVLHELDSVLALLGGVLEEHLGEPVQVDAVLGEVRAHQQVLQRRLELLLHLDMEILFKTSKMTCTVFIGYCD